MADSSAPEAVGAVEQVTGWDDPVEQSGRRVERTPLENEESVSEQLIQNGLEEAYHDLRVASADDQPNENP